MAQCLLGLNKKFIFVMILGILTKCCNSQILGNDVPNFSAEEEVISHSDPLGHSHSDEQMDTGGSAFYALRGCHQVLRGESGEIFSPDYLCSNPPLWCNWTIQVDPRMRIQLYLEDLIQPDACHLKQDQIHVDESTGYYGGHKILQKCWREAKYVSISNTLHVVLLIGGQPSYSYRGFYGRYQAFGPPAVYNPLDNLKEPGWVGVSGTEMPLSVQRATEFSPKSNAEDVDSAPVYDAALSSPEGYDLVYDYYEQTPTLPVMQHWVPRSASGVRMGPLILREDDGPAAHENQPQTFLDRGDYDGGSDAEDSIAEPTVTAQTGRRAAENRSHEDVDRSPETSRPAPHIPTAIRRDVEDMVSHQGGAPTAAPQNISLSVERVTVGVTVESAEEVEEQLGRSESTPPSGDPFVSIDEDSVHPRTPPNGTEQLQDPRTTEDDRNHTEVGHIPGDHLFEVTVELIFQHNPMEHWDHVARSLLHSVKTLISKQLEFLDAPKKIFSKRIKRLSAGALYILWLQVAEGATDQHVHTTVGSTLLELTETPVQLQDRQQRAVIVSVSTADVNECGTHLMLCDTNADCVNHFGSYSCHCRSGFRDVSRLGLGTVCVDRSDAGCRSGPSVEATRGVYVVFFLLSLLILTLLAVMAVIYTRHRRGNFPVHCLSGGFTGDISCSAKGGNRERFPANVDPDLPPPPPPIRRPKEGWSHPKDCCPTGDLPLLRFNPILPLDGLIDPPHEQGKQ